MDGEYERTVTVQLDLEVEEARDSGRANIVRADEARGQGPRYPVFRSQSGTLMTLPGGVIVVFEPEWESGRISNFWGANGINKSLVEQQDFARNAYFIETEPGFPSLNLANELAGQEGVMIGSPNWRSEVTLR